MPAIKLLPQPYGPALLRRLSGDPKEYDSLWKVTRAGRAYYPTYRVVMLSVSQGGVVCSKVL